MVLSMISVGFAHKSAQPNLSPDLAAFVSAGGSLTDICGPLGDSDHRRFAECEACRIADNVMAPRGCNSPVASTIQKTLTFQFVAKRLAHSRGFDPARLTRAPPQA